MSGFQVKIDDRKLMAGLDKLIKEASSQATILKILQSAADKIMEVSGREVPLKDGLLSASSGKEKIADGYKIFYNKVYAAYQHEGVMPDGTKRIKNYRNGRKGKYLEDPIKLNQSTINNEVAKMIKEILLK